MKQNLLEDYKLSIVLLGLCLGFAGIVFLEWQVSKAYRAQLATEISQQKPAPMALEQIPAFQEILGPLDAYDEIINRPLFIEGRAPIENKGVIETISVNTNLDVKLTGIVVNPDDMIALFVDKQNKKYRVRPGDVIQGWEIDELLSDRVIMKQGANRVELLLREPGAAKGPAGEDAVPSQHKPPLLKTTPRPGTVQPKRAAPRSGIIRH